MRKSRLFLQERFCYLYTPPSIIMCMTFLQKLQVIKPNLGCKVLGIGVDVSKDKLDVTVLYSVFKDSDEDHKLYFQMNNTKADINKFLSFLQKIEGEFATVLDEDLDGKLDGNSTTKTVQKKTKKRVQKTTNNVAKSASKSESNPTKKTTPNFNYQIVLESTSYYHLPLLQAGVGKGFKMVLCDTLQAKRFREFLNGCVKTDKIDSNALAYIAKQKMLSAVSASSVGNTDARLILNQIHSLTKTKQTLKSQVKHLKTLGLVSAKHLQKSIENLEDQIADMHKILDAIVAKNYSKESIKLLETIPGISTRIASILLTTLDKNMSIKNWFGYIGLNPVTKQSGKNLYTIGMSKKGSRVLRNTIYQMGFGAGVGKNKPFKFLYDELKKKGRHHTEILIIIGKKILSIFKAILHSGEVFVKPKHLQA